MNRQFKQSLQVTLVALDLFALNTTLLFLLYFFGDKISRAGMYSYYNYIALLNGSWLVLTWLGNLYNERYVLRFEAFMQRTIRFYVIWIAVIMVYLFFAREFQMSRNYILASIFGFALFLLMNRLIYMLIRDYLRKSNRMVNKVIILGYNDVAKKIAQYIEQEGINTQLLGFSENYQNVKELSIYPIVSQIPETINVSKRLNVTEVYSTITPEQNKEVYALMRQAQAECVHFRFIPDFSYFINKPVHVEYLKDMPVLSLRREPLEDLSNRIVKRMLDIMISSFVILFILSWLVPLVGLLIYLESPGPIFFNQMRSGKNNRLFPCLKFRSMRVNKDSDLKQATKNDSRITRIGKFLRKTSLDEFPQFINVWKGEMSIVGPRPHMIRHTEDYSKEVNDYMVRHFLKPGITGWAQVHGYRGEIRCNDDIFNRVSHDIWYLENWSIWLDLRIIIMTAMNIFKGEKNAY